MHGAQHLSLKMSFGLTITGKSDVLEANYSPPIELDGKYEIGLILLETFNSIPNITSENNCFYYDSDKIIKIPEGSYEISDIAKFLRKKLLESSENTEKNKSTESSEKQQQESVKFTLVGNNCTQHSEIYCSYSIDFRKEKPNNIGPVLGFNEFLNANTFYESSEHVSIIKVNTIQVICNISAGAYTNDRQSHSIFEFGINVAPGYRISVFPSKVIYFPVSVRTLSNLSIKLVDQDNRGVNLRGELVVVRVHLRKCR